MQTFRELREEHCYYVDKTAYVKRLLDEGKHYFLSRPRRFGKSLFLDTLKEFFEGNEALFAGLHIHHRHDWSQHHPVVRLSFGGGNFKDPDLLEANVMEQLAAAERRAGVVSEYLTAAGRFAFLLEALHGQTGQRVAVLVDEYDKPILDALVETPEVARANRDYLRGLYGVIKDSDAHVRFTFLTGIRRGCWRRTTAPVWRSCSRRSSRASRTNGTRATTSRTTRATTRACSIPTSRLWDTRSPSRSPAATAAWTWPCAPAGTCTCSSSRWWRWRRRGRRSHRCRSGTTRPIIAAGASRSRWEATDPARRQPVSARGNRST